MAYLDPYNGVWTRREAAHLIRRACFGVTLAELDAAVKAGLSATIDKLFSPVPVPAPPTNPSDGSKWIPDPGQVFTKTVVTSDRNDPTTSTAYDLVKGPGYYNAITKTWWTAHMIMSAPSIQEKLTLFWTNHFATEMTAVQNAIFSWELLSYMRTNAFGSVKGLARRVTLDAAMLRYLNGNTNTKGSPNENYGRELQELFTIGKGPELSQGDYTNYTEQDVRAAAKVLTGWREFQGRDLVVTANDKDLRDNEPRTPPLFPDNPNVVFVSAQHDTSDKQFSEHYGNKVIKGRATTEGAIAELDELLDMIFGQNATSQHIVSRLYIWFVHSDITPEVFDNVIKPLAKDLRTNGWLVGPVLKKLMTSQHFFDETLRGGQIKSPADLVIGMGRMFPGWKLITDPTLVGRYFLGFVNSMTSLQMDLVEPNSVAGYEAYYQSPDYYRMWLTTATSPLRNTFTDAFLVNNNALGKKPIFDTVEFVKQLSSPEDSLGMIEQINEILFAVPFTENTTMMLAEQVLLNGGRYYEWAMMWNTYISNPTAANLAGVRTPLDRLFKYMFRMAEYQIG